MWCQLGHFVASFWGTFEGSERLGDKNGTRKHPAQKRYHSGGRILLSFSVLFGYFGEDVVPKCVFVSMCLASVVLHRKCLDYGTPRTLIIRLKRCRVFQNQGFANLEKVRKSCLPDYHFDVILGTFERQSLTFFAFFGVSFLCSICCAIREWVSHPKEVTGGSPNSSISKDSFQLFRSTKQQF